MSGKLTVGQKIESTVVAINGDTVFIDLSAKWALSMRRNLSVATES